MQVRSTIFGLCIDCRLLASFARCAVWRLAGPSYQTTILLFVRPLCCGSAAAVVVLSAGVATGAIMGHAIATAIAVVGGALISNYISEKTVGYIGGTLFLLFAVATAVGAF